MKTALIILCLTVTAFAQEKVRFGHTAPGMRYAAACGPQAANFKVRLDDSQHGPLFAKPGMAQIYFIHDAGIQYEHITMLYPTVKFGVDGSWAGAGHGDSWFAYTVAPGEHHLCVTLQSKFVDQRVELAHFTAEAGKSYYFRTRLIASQSVELLELSHIDSDQGVYLVSIFPMASSTPKK